ncbi:MAG TPA: integrin alpha, partial [Candidatus Polarisedimenticolia bacterium]|nr:integrin alpha [Candidatus Polarisedimenticolia bacterium]
RGYDNGQQNEGRVLVYAGGPAGPSADAVWAAESNNPYALFGYSVAAAGDVNADGFADLVVGADGFSGAFLSEGRAYLYLGSPGGLEPQPAWTVAGGQADAFLGRSVCGAGDVNGDGLADLLVGADGFDGRYANQGRALLFPGAR